MANKELECLISAVIQHVGFKTYLEIRTTFYELLEEVDSDQDDFDPDDFSL